MTNMQHFVYVLRCSDGTFYCGYTTDVDRRIKEHNGEGKAAGAKYTQGRRPVRAIHTESFASRSEALKREIQIKKMPRQEKEKWYTVTNNK